eukprot:jgi/Ulvmu1/3800/UM018_0010.1
MSPSWIFAAVLAMLIGPFTAAAKDVVVQDVSREINLKQYVVKMTDYYTFAEPVPFVHVCALSQHLGNASNVDIRTEESAGRLDYKQVTLPGQPASVSCMAVTLPKQDVTLAVTITAVDQQTPFPATIQQMDDQYVQFTSTVEVPSPYTVRKQELLVLTASGDIESFTRPASGSAEVKGMRVTYKVPPNTAAWAMQEMRVHFKNNRPFLHILSVDRAITVSHWGRIYVTEDYHVRHDGATVTGRFSRWNATSRARGNIMFPEDNPHIMQLQVNLPAGAQYVIFKDGIGQILTAKATETATTTRVRIEPRYPLFGGWQTRFTLEYSTPLDSLMRTTGGSQRQLSFVQAPLLQEDFQADVVTTRVALPEGSSALRVDAGRLTAAVAEERTFTYLDTAIGRPTAVITTHRMTSDDTSAYVHVSYRFAPLFALLEPALLVAVFATLFAAILGFSRLDLTIVRGAAWRAQQSAAQAHEVLLRVESAAGAARRAAEHVALAPSKDAIAALEAPLDDISAAASELESIGAQRAAALSSFHAACSRLAAEGRKPAKGSKAAPELPPLLAQVAAAHSAAFKGL